ncbi:MAG TPA: hypothetical protein VGB76_01055 [Pyrinomonadaceae bacterium]
MENLLDKAAATDTGDTLIVLSNYDPPAVMPLVREIEQFVTKD